MSGIYDYTPNPLYKGMYTGYDGVPAAVEEEEQEAPAPVILKPIASTCIEGGEWYAWTLEDITEEKLTSAEVRRNKILINIGSSRKHIHAIKFIDGRVWDCLNGWRTNCGRR